MAQEHCGVTDSLFTECCKNGAIPSHTCSVAFSQTAGAVRLCARASESEKYSQRNLTVRHVSRTHRIALDRLLDRMNFDPMMQIEYVDTARQFAHVLHRGSPTREKWNRLIALCNIMDETSAASFRSFRVQFEDSMSRRLAPQEEESRCCKIATRAKSLRLQSSLSKFVVKLKCELSVCSSWETSWAGSELKIYRAIVAKLRCRQTQFCQIKHQET